MNRHQKKFLGTAVAILNVAFSLSVGAIATYAWFQVNAQATITTVGNSLTIQAAEPDEGLSYEVLKYDDNIKAGRSYTGTQAVEQFTLPHYDSYITEKNQYANVIVRAEVSTSSLNTTTEAMTIDITRLASAFRTNGVIGSCTSNVVQFKATVYQYKAVGSDSYTTNTASHNSIDETSAATKYATASAYFASKNTPTTFVPIRDNGDGTVIVNRKNDADTITIIPDLPTGLTLTNVVIYIECTYHDTLVNEFINSHDSEDMSYSLDGDISLIQFGKKTKTANKSEATGKYIKVESEATASSGQYLPTYEASENAGKILKGSLANGNTAIGSGIDTNLNFREVEINSATQSEPKSIDSTDTIDDEAFTYNRTEKTFKSKSGFYIGNNATGNGIKSNSSATGMTNDLSFDQGHAVVASSGGNTLQHYASGNDDRFRYYSGSNHPIDLYRYTENVAEMPTLVSIAITKTPTEAQRTFYTEHPFNINGLEVTATYSDGSTAVVTNSCTFTSPNGVRKLVPEGRTGATTFNSQQLNKTVYVNYSEGAVTLTQTQSYIINVYLKAITSLTKSGSLSTIYYYVGDTFLSAGVTIYGEYNSGDTHIDVTSGCTFSGYNMSAAGNYTVTATHTDTGLTISLGTIYVRAKALSIDPITKTVAEGLTFDITVTHNVPVTITVTNNTGSVTSSAASITYSQVNKATKESTITITAVSAGTATVTFSGSGVSSQTCNITVTETPADHFTMSIGDDIVNSTTYTAYAKSVSKDYNGTGSTSRGWVVTFGGNNSSIGTNSGNRSNCNLSDYSEYAVSPVTTSDVASAFASTDLLYKIHKVSFNFSGGSNPNSTVYLLYSANGTTFNQATLSNDSPLSQGGSMTTSGTNYTFALQNPQTGYFALVFKASNSSGNWRIDGLEVEFNPVSLSSITIGGDLTNKVYNNGDSLNTSGLTVVANYDDGSSQTVTASATLTAATNPLTTGMTSITVNASYTDAKGTTKEASRTITGLTVNAVKVTTITLNKSTASIAVSNTVQLSVSSVGPAAADDKTVTWSVYSGSSFASVTDNGLVTGLAAGTAVIRATAHDGGGAYAECTVTVTAESTGYTVSFNANNGSGSMDSVSNISGSYTLPSNGFTAPSGATFAGWSVGSSTSTTIIAAGGSTNISADTIIYARWQKTVTYTFTNKSWSDSTSSWTSGKAGNGFTSGQGVQITTGATGANATTKSSYNLISQIVVSYCTNASKGAGSIVVQVGSNTAKTFSVTKPSSGGTTLKNATFSYATKETGVIKITGNCTTNSVYIYSVAITYIM